MKILKFKRNKLLGRVDFEEFRRTAEELEEIIRESTSDLDTSITCVDDVGIYNFLTDTKRPLTRSRRMQKKEFVSIYTKKYSKDDFDEKVYENAKGIILHIRGQNMTPRLVLSSDKRRELSFYYSDLNDETAAKILYKFHRFGAFYELKDRFLKILSSTPTTAFSTY